MSEKLKHSIIVLGEGLILALIILFHYSVAQAISHKPFFNDFVKFYASIDYYKAGESIFTSVPLEKYGEMPDELKERFTRDSLHPNLNPPAYSLLFLPFSSLELPTSYMVWTILSIIFGLLSAWLIFNEYRFQFKNRYFRLGIPILLLLYFPAFSTLTLGQVSFVILLLITIGWAASRRGYDNIAGISLGLALSLKLFVGLFLIVFLIMRRWKLLFWMVGTFILTSFIGMLVFGKESYNEYLNVIGEVTWYAASWNASFMGFFTRIFGGSENVPLVNLPALASIMTYGCSLIVVAQLIRFTLSKSSRSSHSRYDMLFAFTIIAMLIVSPLGWMYYFVLLIIPLIIIWIRAGQTFNSLPVILMVIAWALSTIPHQIVPSAEITPMNIFFWAGVYFYALLLFIWILILYLRNNKLRKHQRIEK